jgi:hypothetical protein
MILTAIDINTTRGRTVVLTAIMVLLRKVKYILHITKNIIVVLQEFFLLYQQVAMTIFLVKEVNSADEHAHSFH